MVATARIPFAEADPQPLVSSTASTLETFASEALDRVKEYARDEPLKFALWAFGLGFVVGWRIKPW